MHSRRVKHCPDWTDSHCFPLGRRMRLKRVAWFFALLLLAGSVLSAKWVYDNVYHLDSIPLAVSLPALRVARPMYPFSVIPGGVHDARELAESITRDPVAREHYKGIQTERLWPTSSERPMSAFVSYRKGDSVYWTDHAVKIAAGELLLTDGANLIRGRCGNRMAFRQPTPLSRAATPPEGPPPDIAFETPLPGLVPATVSQPDPPAVVIARSTPGHQYSPPPVWCCAQPKPVVAVVPEPSTLGLLGTGLFTTVAFLRRRRR